MTSQIGLINPNVPLRNPQELLSCFTKKRTGWIGWIHIFHHISGLPQSETPNVGFLQTSWESGSIPTSTTSTTSINPTLVKFHISLAWNPPIFGWNLQISVGHLLGFSIDSVRESIIHPSFNPSFPLKSDSKSFSVSIPFSIPSLNFHWFNMINSPLFIDKPPSFHWFKNQFYPIFMWKILQHLPISTFFCVATTRSPTSSARSRDPSAPPLVAPSSRRRRHRCPSSPWNRRWSWRDGNVKKRMHEYITIDKNHTIYIYIYVCYRYKYVYI